MFQEALTEILSRLEAAQNRKLLQAYALIGGFAVSAWGVPRATNDIDFVVAIGAADPQALAIFLGGRFEAGEADDPLRGVVHTSIQVGSTPVSIQLIFFPSAITEIAFRRVETFSVLERMVPDCVLAGIGSSQTLCRGTPRYARCSADSTGKVPTTRGFQENWGNG